MKENENKNKDAISEIKIQYSRLEVTMGYIKQSVDDILHRLEKNYVTRDELSVTNVKIAFLEKVVYGVVGIAAVGLIGYAMKVIFSLK